MAAGKSSSPIKASTYSARALAALLGPTGNGDGTHTNTLTQCLSPSVYLFSSPIYSFTARCVRVLLARCMTQGRKQEYQRIQDRRAGRPSLHPVPPRCPCLTSPPCGLRRSLLQPTVRVFLLFLLRRSRSSSSNNPISRRGNTLAEVKLATFRRRLLPM